MLNTNHKLLIARALCSVVMAARRTVGLPATVIATRGGIRWSLDLREGIDLAIYLLGGFEVRTLRRYPSHVHDGDIVLDIGANIGAHTLPLAKLVGAGGRVISFEPTRYAFDKLGRNVLLNPDLAPRITAHQMMLVAGDSDQLPESIHSSWPLENASDLDKENRGRLKTTEGATAMKLDDYVRSAGLPRVDFIKLDVDGNECSVLNGGRETLQRFKPAMMMELAPYVYEASPQQFDDMLGLLWELGYEIADVAGGGALPHDPGKVRLRIPPQGGMNVLATIGN